MNIPFFLSNKYGVINKKHYVKLRIRYQMIIFIIVILQIQHQRRFRTITKFFRARRLLV